jgi:hypothetical protein
LLAGNKRLTISVTPTAASMLLLRSTHIDMRKYGGTAPVPVGPPFIITITMKSPFTSARIQAHRGGQMLPWKALWMALADGEQARIPLCPTLTCTRIVGGYTVSCHASLATYVTFEVIP